MKSPGAVLSGMTTTVSSFSKTHFLGSGHPLCCGGQSASMVDGNCACNVPSGKAQACGAEQGSDCECSHNPSSVTLTGTEGQLISPAVHAELTRLLKDNAPNHTSFLPLVSALVVHGLLSGKLYEGASSWAPDSLVTKGGGESDYGSCGRGGHCPGNGPPPPVGGAKYYSVSGVPSNVTHPLEAGEALAHSNATDSWGEVAATSNPVSDRFDYHFGELHTEGHLLVLNQRTIDLSIGGGLGSSNDSALAEMWRPMVNPADSGQAVYLATSAAQELKCDDIRIQGTTEKHGPFPSNQKQWDTWQKIAEEDAASKCHKRCMKKPCNNSSQDCISLGVFDLRLYGSGTG